ncbi:hypothetical protein GCM10023201_27920 [Actinomycetospora corticicola]|uniref:Short chain dehydrogenase n=1 Tax=Actinomycetospora corticicola TaxID=663602 RepID=A0A7Y9J6C2_9PSEU|nr:hypothetical protein [Actinomycetospora corticicola]NYD37075.1 hypothetical protein [Actinomycetospora corticicola]
MTTVLVTGGGERLEQVAAAVKAAGADTVVVDDPGRLGEAVAGQKFDGYVQLPVAMTPGEGSVVAKVEQFLTQGMLSRFRAAATVLPALQPDASVMLVGGQTNVDVDAPDDADARAAMLRVLAHALRAERAPDRLTVRVADSSWTAEQIAAKITGTGPKGAGEQTADDAAIGKAYADWRAEVVGMARVEF